MVSKIPPVATKNDGSVTFDIQEGQSHTTNYYSPMTFATKKRGVVVSPVIDVSYKPIENLAIGVRATSTEVGGTVC